MNLKDYVATGPEALAVFTRPFYIIDAEGHQWAAACDAKTLVLVKTKLNLRKFSGPKEDWDRFAEWTTMTHPDPLTVDVAELLDWTGPADGNERKGVILGVQIDQTRLAKLLSVLSGEVVIWNGADTVGIPCLFLTKSGVWKALLAGYDGTDEDVSAFSKVNPDNDLFMGLDD